MPRGWRSWCWGDENDKGGGSDGVGSDGSGGGSDGTTDNNNSEYGGIVVGEGSSGGRSGKNRGEHVEVVETTDGDGDGDS